MSHHKVILLLGLLVLTLSQGQLFFLYEGGAEEGRPDLLELSNNPWNIPVKPVDCSVAEKCLKYKAGGDLPQLVLWPGPGNGYKQLGPAKIQYLKAFMDRRDNNPIKPLRDFLEEISFSQCMVLAFLMMFVLHAMFSFLFKDRSEKPKQQ